MSPQQAKLPNSPKIRHILVNNYLQHSSNHQNITQKESFPEPFLLKTINDPVAVFTALLALFTLGLWLFTALMWWVTRRAVNESIASSAQRDNDTRKSIEQATKSTLAMEDVAASMAINAKQILETVKINKEISTNQKIFSEINLRAYINVFLGPSFYQKDNILFQPQISIKNDGATPARNLRWNISSEILPTILPPDFKFRLAKVVLGGGMLGAREVGTIAGPTIPAVPVELETKIKRGDGESLYVWGYISYKDVFGHRRRTVFAQQLYWKPGPPGEDGNLTETLQVNYLTRHNNSN